ncbi:uncharacterized protein LOC112679514 [Sipha flava]|uniref:Uncharacterized protein LOC112679514 n=1 Tax=Sipha flava TaxID=143950 RepID=A0A2S2R0D9_9HEMI|nr:uncharacterized protein LOC112679514 [Sipha flava]
MVGLTAPSGFWAAAIGLLCGLYGSYTGAVMARSKNDSSNANLQNGIRSSSSTTAAGTTSSSLRDGLETSQTRVNTVDGPSPSDNFNRGSDYRVSGKDFGGGGSGGYPFQNTYGPPGDYYYDERPEYFRPNHHVGSRPPSGPPDVFYHDHPPHQQPQHYGGEGQHHHHGELNVQPLLWPLAGITLLGVLSALVKAPLLLHLGTVGHRRRRRRDVTDPDRGITAKAIKSLLAKFNDKERRWKNPEACLVCDMVASIYDLKSTCVERSVCEVMSGNGSGAAVTDKLLLSAMITQVVENDQIPKEMKRRLQESAETGGRSGEDCRRLYPCHAPETAQK